MPTVLVTGANGFVGRPLCGRLLAEGWRVIGAVRRPEAVRELPEGVEPRLVPNLTDDVDWSPLLRDVNSVVHLVARTHVLGEHGGAALADYRRLNVEATRRLVRGAREAGVRRFAFVSSIKAVGEGAADAYSERTPCQPQDAYGRSKLEAEQALFEEARGSDLEPVVLRPPLVYGPHVRGNFRTLLGAIANRTPLPLARIHAVRSLVSVENLASATALALAHRDAAGHVYHVADDEAVSTRELAERLGELLERPTRLLPCPAFALRLAGRLTGRSGQVDRLVNSLKVDARTIREVLGWRASVTLDDGLRTTVDWYRRDILGLERRSPSPSHLASHRRAPTGRAA